jgi:hypothetical protein
MARKQKPASYQSAVPQPGSRFRQCYLRQPEAKSRHCIVDDGNARLTRYFRQLYAVLELVLMTILLDSDRLLPRELIKRWGRSEGMRLFRYASIYLICVFLYYRYKLPGTAGQYNALHYVHRDQNARAKAVPARQTDLPFRYGHIITMISADNKFHF